MTDPTPHRRPRPVRTRVEAETGRTIVTAGDSQTLLRLVPALAGLEPERSVVLLLFEGRRSHGALRIDLPPDDDPRRLTRWAGQVVGLACKVRGVTGIAPIVYTPDSFAPSGRVPRVAVLRGIDRAAARAGLDVEDLLCVAADGWGSPADPDLPRGGRPLADLEPLPDGLVDARDRIDVVPGFEQTSEPAREAFQDAVRRWWTRVGGPLGPDGRPLHGVDLRRPERRGAAFRRRDDHVGSAFHRMRFGEETAAAVALVEAALGPHDVDADRPCPCLALLHCFSTREGLNGLVLAQIGWGAEVGRRLWDASFKGDPSAPALRELSDRLGGRSTDRPDRERVRTAIRLLLTVGAHVPPGSRAGVDAMLAWLHWSLGASTVAGRLAERAIAAGRDQELAEVVRRLAASLPEWAFGEPDLAMPA